MKKIIYFIAFLAITFTSCNDDDFGSDGIESVDFNLNLSYDSEVYNGETVEGATVVLNNTETGDEYTSISEETGISSFIDILPGTYNVTVTQTLTSDEFKSVFSYEPETEEVIFNGSLELLSINVSIPSADVELKTARIGDLVIKQIYYVGSSTSQGAVFRDQFIEIYNNSNETIYADGLYIAQLFDNNSTDVESFTLSDGKYDWTQSIGMTNLEANTNYVYAEYVIKIPGTGVDYPLEPGETILIAQTGINHKAPLVDNDGDDLSVENPDLTVDLSGADFEVYLGDYRESLGESVYQWDIQNPAVKDITIAYWGNPNNGNKDFLLDTFGRDSFAIFFSDDLDSYPYYFDPEDTEGTGDEYLQIPNSKIIDGVELQNYKETSARPKMFSSEIDASSIKCDGKYNSQSVIRKTKNTLDDGRIILEDTNNSSEDFEVLDMASPGGFGN